MFRVLSIVRIATLAVEPVLSDTILRQKNCKLRQMVTASSIYLYACKCIIYGTVIN